MAFLPSPQECLVLLQRCGCSDQVIRHCLAVRDVAVRMAERSHAYVPLVEAGALLHDIGRSKTHGIFHGVEGAKIARELGLPVGIVRIIERHLGAGISREEAKKLGLPPKDYLPETLEEKIVCHADNLIENNNRQNIKEEIQRAIQEGHREYAERLQRLHNELSEKCGMDVNRI